MMLYYQIHAPSWRFLPSAERTARELRAFFRIAPALLRGGYRPEWN